MTVLVEVTVLMLARESLDEIVDTEGQRKRVILENLQGVITVGKSRKAIARLLSLLRGLERKSCGRWYWWKIVNVQAGDPPFKRFPNAPKRWAVYAPFATRHGWVQNEP